MNDLSGRDMHRYKIWRRDKGDLAPASLKTQIATIRVFVRFCQRIDAVQSGVADSIQAPSLSKEDGHREVRLAANEAKQLLDRLNRFSYASFEHTLMGILWHTGIRTGGIRALDLRDFDVEKARLKVRHRPGTDTPLKNGKDGERLIALSAEMAQVIEDWINHSRPDKSDGHGREPLLTTSHGRPHPSTIRDTTYRLTRPCEYAECPHSRSKDECEATDDQAKTASKCPSAVSPHAIRRGSITHHLTEDVPEKVVSDRMNVGPDVLDKHYDERSEAVKVEQRRGYLNNL